MRDRGDEESDGTVTFERLSVQDRDAIQPWQSLSEFVSRTAAASPALIAGQLAESALAQLVAHTALSLFANDTWTAPTETALARDSLDGTSLAVRRAVAFIDAHAHTDITLVDIAAAAYVTPRALQYGFRRRLDTTPMAYLRTVRLHHARAELLDPGRRHHRGPGGRPLGLLPPRPVRALLPRRVRREPGPDARRARLSHACQEERGRGRRP